MTVKASISISEQQNQFARQLVEEGRFSSLSAVVQHGLELIRSETELREAELAALRGLLAERADGEFLSMEEGRADVQNMISAKRAAHDL